MEFSKARSDGFPVPVSEQYHSVAKCAQNSVLRCVFVREFSQCDIFDLVKLGLYRIKFYSMAIRLKEWLDHLIFTSEFKSSRMPKS